MEAAVKTEAVEVVIPCIGATTRGTGGNSPQLLSWETMKPLVPSNFEQL